MARLLPRLFLVVALLVLAAWVSPLAMMITALPDETKRSVTLPAGETLQLRLPSTPGTGYRWRLSSIEGGPVRYLGEGEFEEGAGSGVGVQGHQVFSFTGKQAGLATIVLDYLRPWEVDRPPARRIELRMDIRPNQGGEHP